MFFALFGAECWAAKRYSTDGLSVRLPLYLIALSMFYLSAAGVARQPDGKEFNSMVRYAFPVEVILALGLAHLVSRLPQQQRWMESVALWTAAPLALVGAAIQALFMTMFTRGMWVA
jgi:hypothetical protein